jgi:hypothetical protein
MLYFCVFVACHPRRSPGFHEINAQFASRMGLREPSPLEGAVAEKHRVLPVFGHNRPHVSPLECAVQSSPVTVDSKWITKKLTPLECALTKNKGGAPGQMFFPFFVPFPMFGPCDVPTVRRSVSHLPYTLPSSVSCKSFVCRSYENTGGVGVFFPFWNSPLPNVRTLRPSDVPSLRRRLIQA